MSYSLQDVENIMEKIKGLLAIYEHKYVDNEYTYNLANGEYLRITIPESLEYNDVFKDVFDHYLKECSSEGVKTTGMGSMYKLSYRIKMKDDKDEKEMIDDLNN